jgi:hypothetical protein
MSDNEALARRAEDVIGRRKLLMGVIIAGLAVMCGAMLTKHLGVTHWDPETMKLVREVGFGIVLAGIVGSAAIRRGVRRNPDLRAMVEDERAVHVRHQMFFYGYFVLLFGVTLSVLLTVFGVIDAEAAFLVMLLAGGITPPMMFILLR